MPKTSSKRYVRSHVAFDFLLPGIDGKISLRFWTVSITLETNGKATINITLLLFVITEKLIKFNQFLVILSKGHGKSCIILTITYLFSFWALKD